MPGAPTRTRRRPALIAAAAAVLAVLPVAPIMPSASASLVPSATASIPVSTRSAPYTFLLTQPAGGSAPVRWDPCRVHRFKIYGRGSTQAMRDTLRASVARLSRASGMTWVYAGLTSVVPRRSNATSLPRLAGADVVLAFARPGSGTGRSDLLPTSSTLLGVGGASYRWSGSGLAWYSSGYAVFDIRRVPGTLSGRTRMFEHEVGHAFGLGHVGLRPEVMYPVQSPSSPTWSTGFAHGLLAVGRPAGCRA